MGLKADMRFADLRDIMPSQRLQGVFVFSIILQSLPNISQSVGRASPSWMSMSIMEMELKVYSMTVTMSSQCHCMRIHRDFTPSIGGRPMRPEKDGAQDLISTLLYPAKRV